MQFPCCFGEGAGAEYLNQFPILQLFVLSDTITVPYFFTDLDLVPFCFINILAAVELALKYIHSRNYCHVISKKLIILR
jgi:hypothetical protein